MEHSKSIYFFNEDSKYILKNKGKLRNWINKAVNKEGYIIENINFIFCSDEFLLQLNKVHLGHDFYTDIITFNNNFKKTKSLNGEVYISLDRVKENSKAYKTTFINELNRVIIHGVLHLCGNKDKSKKAQSQMRKKEDYYLNLRTKLN